MKKKLLTNVNKKLETPEKINSMGNQMAQTANKNAAIKTTIQNNIKKIVSKDQASETKVIRNLIRKSISIVSPHNRGEKVIFRTLADLKKEYKINPLYVYKAGLDCLTPGLRLEPKIKGGKVLYYPANLPGASSYYFAIKWLLSATSSRDKKLKLNEKLSLELTDAFVDRGAAYKAKMEFFKTILASRVYAPVPTFSSDSSVK